MSLLSKLTSLFQSNTTTQVPQSPKNPKLELVLYQIMKPSLKFDFKQTSEILIEHFYEKEDNIDQFFTFLSQPAASQQKSLLPISFIQLLVSFHFLYLNSQLQYEIALRLKESKIYWLSYIEQKQNVKDFDIDPNEVRALSQMDYQKNNFNMDNRSSYENKEDRFQSVDLVSFSKTYYIYLQRLGANVDLYVAVTQGNYPYQKSNELVEAKLMFLWHYKIQNIINTGLGLIYTFDMTISEVQKLIWMDLYMFQQFVSKEIAKVAENYATLPNSDTLSLYEIYCDAMKHFDVMKSFQTKAKLLNLQEPPFPQMGPQLLQDFLSFAFKLKMLNQMTFKKSIKVPNKQNPCLGIPIYHPQTLHHLRAMSGMLIRKTNEEKEIEEQIVQEEIRQEEHEDNSDEEYDDQVAPMTSQKQKAAKVVHLRGLSTFQNK